MTEILDNFQICGYILSSANYSLFALQCVKCSTNFEQWSSFMHHLDQLHGDFSAKRKRTDNFCNENCIDATVTPESRKDELETNNIREEHSVFLEVNDDIEIRGNEIDELMVEVMHVYETGLDNENNTQNLLEERVSSEENLFGDNEIDVSSSASQTEEFKGTQRSEFKKFRFSLTNLVYSQMSSDFLKVFQTQQLLWDPNHEHFNNIRKCSQARNKIKLFFKEKKINISDEILQSTISKLLTKYKLAQQKRNTKDEIDLETEKLLQECSFLDRVVKNDADDNLMTPEDEDEERDLINDVCPTTKIVNYIPFTVSDPLFEDFIENYKSNRVLWDTSLYNYNHRLDRKAILDNWRDHFKSKYNLPITTEDLSYSILEFRRIYYKSVLRRDSNIKLDDTAKYILEKGHFLPPKTIIRPIKCQHCNKIFHQEYTLKRHIYLDHGIGEKPFKCSFCEQSFVDHLMHRRHEQRYHYKDYKYICTYCAKAFFTRDELDRHIMKHTGEKKFVCELCGRAFAKKTNLNLHNTRIHLRQRNFPCDMCPKAFYTKRLLQDHVNAHLNIRDKICSICSKGFTSHHSLIRHKQIHSEIKKYACKLCDARFHQFVGLNSHMKNTHKYVKGKNEATSDDDDGRGKIDDGILSI